MMKLYNTNTLKNGVLTNKSEPYYVSIFWNNFYLYCVNYRTVSTEFCLFELWKTLELHNLNVHIFLNFKIMTVKIVCECYFYLY